MRREQDQVVREDGTPYYSCELCVFVSTSSLRSVAQMPRESTHNPGSGLRNHTGTCTSVRSDQLGTTLPWPPRISESDEEHAPMMRL